VRPRLVAATHLLTFVFLSASQARASPIVSIAIDRDIPTTILVSTGRVFQSTDGGVQWRSTGPGLDGPVTKVVSAGGGRWFAATDSRVFRTLDGGASWIPSGPVFGSHVHDLVVAPSSGFTLYASWSVGVVYSRDGGESWWPVGGGLPPDHLAQLAVDPTNDKVLYAAGRGGLYVSSDGGANWVRTPFPLGPFRTGGVLQAGIDPNRPETIYVSRLDCALCLFPVLARSDDAGVTAVDVLGTFPGLVFAIDRGSVVFVSTSRELIRSFDRGATWEPSGANSPSDLTALATSPSSGLLLAGSRDGDLYAASDHGTSWRRLTHPDSGCAAGSAGICLASGRFNIAVTFTSADGLRSSAAGGLLTDNAGAFWFFSGNNLELVVKVVDGHAFNGHFWVFLAGLSDVEYSVAVTDIFTGATRLYRNARGELRSQADTSAF